MQKVSFFQRVLIVALREYRAMVGTKAFLLSALLMPVLMSGSIVLPELLDRVEKVKDRTIVVADGTGAIFAKLSESADRRNALLDAAAESGEADDKKDPVAQAAAGFGDRNLRYKLQRWDGGMDDAKRVELSTQVRDQTIYAFVEIPSNVLAEPGVSVRYHAENAAISRARRWLNGEVNNIARIERLRQQGFDPNIVAQATMPISVEPEGLYERGADGELTQDEKPSIVLSLLLPFGIMMIIFVSIMMAAQPMLESVIEEKSERIAEVLLGCVTPSQLLLGKLLGNVAGSLCTFLLYAIGGAAVVHWQGWGGNFPLRLIPLFAVYQLLGVLFFSSIFLAIGASVSQLKEAQSMLLPVWMMMCLPMFALSRVAMAPNETLAVVLSFFPPSAPLMMVLRLAAGAAVPLWQIVSSIAVLIISTALVVIAAGRVFQIGILWQGKSPSLGQMLRWVLINPLVAEAK